FSRSRRHTSLSRDWSSDVCSSDLFCPTPNTAPDNTMCADSLHSRNTINFYRMNNWKEQIEKNKDRYLDELFSLLSIPSVSAKTRSEERRVGKECRRRRAPEHEHRT